jgi:stringent starvation protein B
MNVTSSIVPVPVTAMNNDNVVLKISTNSTNNKLQVTSDNNSGSSSVGFHLSLLPIIAITCIVAVPLVLVLAVVFAQCCSHTEGSKKKKNPYNSRRHNQYQKLHQEDGDVNSDTELL